MSAEHHIFFFNIFLLYCIMSYMKIFPTSLLSKKMITSPDMDYIRAFLTAKSM